MSSKPKLLFLNYSLGIGGIEKMIEEFVTRLKDKYDISVAVFKSGGPIEQVIEDMGVSVFHFNKKCCR